MKTITGNTFPVKDALRALGGRWNADSKCWMVPDAKAEQARKLVAEALVTAKTLGKCSKCGTACKAPFTLCWSCKTGSSGSGHVRPRGRGTYGCSNGQCYCPECSSGSECLCRCSCGFGG